MTFEERRKRECASHHGLGSRKRWIASIHVAEVDLSFVRDSSPTEQHVVSVEESDPCTTFTQARAAQQPCNPPPKIPTRINNPALYSNRCFSHRYSHTPKNSKNCSRSKELQNSGNLLVQLGLATEPLNRLWYERTTGQVIQGVQTWIRHPVIRWMAATLDGIVEGNGAVFEAKFMLPWSFSEEAAAEKHMAQAPAQHVGGQCQGRGALDHYRRRQVGGN